MEKFKCANCGKGLDSKDIKYLNLTKDLYIICSKCEKICKEFKQKHELT